MVEQGFDAELQRVHGKVHDVAKTEILRLHHRGDARRAAAVTRALTAWARELAAQGEGIGQSEEHGVVVQIKAGS